jgi:hypothetical protein
LELGWDNHQTVEKALNPFQFVVIVLAAWMNQRQQNVIEYLREENRILREELGDRRLRFNDDQRRRLAVRAKGLGRKLLMEIATLASNTSDAVSMAPQTDCTEVRRQCEAETRSTCYQEGPSGPGGSHGRRESRLGLPANSGRVIQFGTRMRPQHDRWYSAAARHRTSAPAESKNNLERVPHASLGSDRIGGLLHHRGLDKQRTNALSGPLLHRFVYPKGSDCGDCVAREWFVDESSGPSTWRMQ